MTFDILSTTTKMCIEFQEASAASYAYARDAMEHDRYLPRVRNHQQCSADLAADARIRLDRINGHA